MEPPVSSRDPVLNCESEKVERDSAGSGGDPVRSMDARLALRLVVFAMDGPARPLFLRRRLGLVPPSGIFHTPRAMVTAAAVLPQRPAGGRAHYPGALPDLRIESGAIELALPGPA